MTRSSRYSLALALAMSLAAALHPAAAAADTASSPPSVRVAAIGGINDHGFWDRLAKRFEETTGIKVQTVATGRKDGASDLFRRGGIDVITMQSAEQIVGLVADGWAADPQPWVQSDLVLVGPASDPAGARGAADLAAALKRIVAAKAPLLVHDNAGTHDVIRGVIQRNGIELPDDSTAYVLDDHQRRVITLAAERKAYTLIGRVPFRSGKLANAGLTVMVARDPCLRRPFLVATADPARVEGARTREAMKLVAFLRSPDTQAWIAEFGKGQLDDRALFIPVTIPATTTAASQPAARASHTSSK